MKDNHQKQKGVRKYVFYRTETRKDYLLGCADFGLLSPGSENEHNSDRDGKWLFLALEQCYPAEIWCDTQMWATYVLFKFLVDTFF